MPNRASVHQPLAPGGAKELASHRWGVNDWNRWPGVWSGDSGPRTELWA